MFQKLYRTILDEVRCCDCVITIGFTGLLASGALGIGTAVALS